MWLRILHGPERFAFANVTLGWDILRSGQRWCCRSSLLLTRIAAFHAAASGGEVLQAGLPARILLRSQPTGG
jgi:hypothetical protein